MIKIKRTNKNEGIKDFDHKVLNDDYIIINTKPTKELLIELLLDNRIQEIYYSMDVNLNSHNPLMWTRFE